MTDPVLTVGYAPPYFPQSFDYTSRDYPAILSHLKDVVRTRVPEATLEDPADLLLALIEAYAYMGDLMSYYIDRAANESFLPTATRRQSVMNLARMLGYTPGRAVPSTGEVTLANTGTLTVTVPKNTVLSAKVARENGTLDVVQFTTDTEVSVPAGVTNVSVTVTEGYMADSTLTNGHGVVLAVSDGSAEQSYELPSHPVSMGSMEVFTYDQVQYILWQEVNSLAEYTATSNVYTTTLMADNTVVVQFGDGTSGRIPPNTHQISAKYRVGGGTRGNLPANAVKFIENPAIDTSLDIMSSTSMTGGTDEESTFTIRSNASMSFRPNRRAVNKSDLEALAVQVEGCEHAEAHAATWSSITLVVAPNNDGSLTPGMTPTVSGANVITKDNATLSTEAMKTQIATYVSPLMMMGASLTVRDPDYVKVKISLKVSVIDTVKQDYVRSHLLSLIKGGPLSYSQRGFGGDLTVAHITSILSQTGYVTALEVTDLFRKDAPGVTSGIYPIIGAKWYEILVLDPDDLTITLTGGSP